MSHQLTIVSICVAACVSTTALAQELIVDSDNRSGGNSVFVKGVGSVDPVESNYNIDPGENEYELIDLEFDVFDGDDEQGVTINSTLDTMSNYVGYDEDFFTFDSLTMMSQGWVEINSSGSFDYFGSCNDFIDMGFRIEDLGPDGSFTFNLTGQVFNGSIELRRGGNVIFQSNNGAFNQDILITQTGEYKLVGQASISLSGSNPTSQIVGFNFSANLVIDQGCPADITGNGVVDAADLAVLLGEWGDCCEGDLNGDNMVNAGDLAILLGSWGPC